MYMIAFGFLALDFEEAAPAFWTRRRKKTITVEA
jgi:hypothetical protein